MVSYRTFRNSDPPRILELWQQCATSRGFGLLERCDKLEQLVFSKPYFDREGVILAFEDDRLIGYCHAGFGGSQEGHQLDKRHGAICMLMVLPEFRRRGIGTELLQRGQRYLAERGANVIFCGAVYPVNPFYLGLYGGSEMPGILESSAEMIAFVEARGYRATDTCLVHQMDLDPPPTLNDPRLPLKRREVEFMVEPWPLSPNWWHACVYGAVDSLRYEVTRRESNEVIGHAWVWEMDAFHKRFGTIIVGVSELKMEEAYRNQGFGRLLLATIQKHLKEQKIGRLEIQTMQDNEIALRLFTSLGFKQVDTGRAYRLGS
ncbi:putative acetyltransferase [Planctomycetes bacterium Pan216]|uniref:Putative acetyltransferase n=1 Tax=Kolteria novifilia TaxID=2527975 RepID=A0A518AXW6_9BACT|nr:putative acetyltransferase [Planctomycetes bacterium Pan216]